MVMALSLLAALIGVPWAAEASPDTSAIVSATNQYRAQNGLQPLAENAAMNAVAQSWAQQMAANGQMTHNPNYSTQIPAGWSAAGENVATGHRSPTLVVDAWMNSAGHRANILSTSYNSIGAGWFVDARGVSWSVQVFARYAGVTAPGVLYKNAYSGTIYEIVGTSPVSISFERWRDHYRYQAPLATSTDYVKYPWSSSIAHGSGTALHLSSGARQDVRPLEMPGGSKAAPTTSGQLLRSCSSSGRMGLFTS
jgi:hypothetical protein